MLAKMVKIAKTALFLWGAGAAYTTVGELSRWSRIPKSTVRRYVEKLEKKGFVHLEFNSYKRTGVWEIRLTDTGKQFANSQGELF